MSEVASEDTPKVKDLIEDSHLKDVLDDSKAHGFQVFRTVSKGKANKIPLKKIQIQNLASMSCLVGEMKCTERIMNFLENSEIIDGFDPNHEVVQSLYGELCMYLLKLDKALKDNYGVSSSIDNNAIEIRSQDYLNKFYNRRDKITKLQKLLKDENTD